MNTFSGHLSWCLAYLKFPRIIWKPNLNRCPSCPSAVCSVRTFCFEGGSVTHLYRSHQVCESLIWQRGRGLCYLHLTCSEEVTHHPLKDLGNDSHIILLWSTCLRIPYCEIPTLVSFEITWQSLIWSKWRDNIVLDIMEHSKIPLPPMQLFFSRH